MTKLWVWVEPERFVAYESEHPRDKNGDPLVLGEPFCVMELSDGGKGDATLSPAEL